MTNYGWAQDNQNGLMDLDLYVGLGANEN